MVQDGILTGTSENNVLCKIRTGLRETLFKNNRQNRGTLSQFDM